MGHKTHPIGFRLGIENNWKTRWFSLNSFKNFLLEDIKIRKFLDKKLKRLGLAEIEIERSAKKTKVLIYVSKPGLIIGRGGAGIDTLRQELNKLLKTENIQLAVNEVKRPYLSSKIVAEEMAGQIERRIPEKKIINGAVEKVMEAGAMGVRVAISGRIGGQEIARTIYKTAGTVPLQIIDAEIDFIKTTALTKYGIMGIKVWIYKGLKNRRNAAAKNEDKKENRRPIEKKDIKKLKKDK